MPEHLQDLVRRAADGDNEAFGDLYRTYFDQIYDFLCRLTRNADDAADLAQETFLRAMDGLPSLREPGSFKTWLFSIAHRVALSRMAAAKRTTPLDDGEHHESRYQVVDHDRLSDPEAVAIAEEVRALVWEAAAGLEPRQRSVLALHVREGMDVPELAESLGTTRNNAAVLLHRTRKAMELAVGAAIVVRAGPGRCTELAAIVAAAEGPAMTELLRREVDGHIETCGTCRTTRRRMTPLAVFGAFVPVAAPEGLKETILEHLTSAEGPAASGTRPEPGNDVEAEKANKIELDSSPSRLRRAAKGWPIRAAGVAVLFTIIALIAGTLMLDSESVPASAGPQRNLVAFDRDSTGVPSARTAPAQGAETASPDATLASPAASPSSIATATPTPTATTTPDPAPMMPGEPELPVAPPPGGGASPEPRPEEQPTTPEARDKDEERDDGSDQERTCVPTVSAKPGRVELTTANPTGLLRISTGGDCPHLVTVAVSEAADWLEVSARSLDVSPGSFADIVVSLRAGREPASDMAATLHISWDGGSTQVSVIFIAPDDPRPERPAPEEEPDDDNSGGGGGPPVGPPIITSPGSSPTPPCSSIICP